MRYIKTRRRLLQALEFRRVLFRSFASHADRPAGRIVVIVAPGGSADALARMVANKAGERLQINFVVENKPGAGGNIASQTVVRSDPDGNTLLVTANNHTINPTLFKNAGYTIDELVPVAQLMQGPSVIVVPSNSKRSEEHTSELQSLMRISYAVFCLKKK